MNLKKPKEFKNYMEYHSYVSEFYSNTSFDTYEQALEFGLQQALKLL